MKIFSLLPLQTELKDIFNSGKKLASGTNSGKSEGVVWINLPWEGPEGNQTFPQGKSDYPRDLPGAYFSGKP